MCIFEYRKQQSIDKLLKIMKASDLKVGSIVEVPVNFSPERMEEPTQVKIKRVSEHYLWFDKNMLQRMGVNTFQSFVDASYYKIISI